MPLETATYISDLVPSNPAASDLLSGADDHMRLIKSTLQATLAHTGQITNADNQLIPADGTAVKPAYAFASEPTLGFYRSATGVLSFVGGSMRGADVGELKQFLVEPAGLGKGGNGTGHTYLELDGSTWNNSDYPALAAHLGQGGTTFTLKNVRDTGRFLRSRTTSVSAGTSQANQNAAHAHTVSGNTATESQGHVHTGRGTTGDDSPDHYHSGVVTGSTPSTTGGGGFTVVGALTTGNTNGASTRHQHPFSFTSDAESSSHTHTISLTSGSSGGAEARPEALSVIMCIKT